MNRRFIRRNCIASVVRTANKRFQMSNLPYRTGGIIADRSVATGALHSGPNDRRLCDRQAKTTAMTFTPIQRGVVCPTGTPLKPDGDINLDMIAPIIDKSKTVAAATIAAVAGPLPNLDRPRHPHSACETELAFDSAIALMIRNRAGSALRSRAPEPQPGLLLATVRRY